MGKSLLRVSAQPLLTREGGAPHVAVTLMALEQESASQERMRQIETELTQFRALFEKLPLIFWTVAPGRHARYLQPVLVRVHGPLSESA